MTNKYTWEEQKKIVKDYFNGKSYPLDAIHHTIAK